MESLFLTMNQIQASIASSQWALALLDVSFVVAYVYRGQDIRIISARSAEPHEREEYEKQLP